MRANNSRLPFRFLGAGRDSQHSSVVDSLALRRLWLGEGRSA